MQTKLNLQQKIIELESCLSAMASEHESRHLIQNDLRKLKAELAELEKDNRTIERDTFDFRNHQFTADENI